MVSYFGPVPDELLEHISDDENDDWRRILGVLNTSYGTGGEPWQSFSKWGDEVFPYLSHEEGFQHLDPEFKRFIGRMMMLAPAKRAMVDELLEDPWWRTRETECTAVVR